MDSLSGDSFDDFNFSDFDIPLDVSSQENQPVDCSSDSDADATPSPLESDEGEEEEVDEESDQ